MRPYTDSYRFVCGNVSKAENYSAAWRQIKKATDNGFYIEALSIQESILSDRLLHHLHKYYGLPLRNKKNWHHTLNDLVNYTRAVSTDGGMVKILSRFSLWRNKRNIAVHALVRSDPGVKEVPADVFFTKARRAALVGTRITRDVDNWCRRDATRIKRMKLRHNNSQSGIISPILPASPIDKAQRR